MVDAVLDTNLYISALNFGGLPLEILLLGVRKKIGLFLSPAILQEIEGVLLVKFDWQLSRIEATSAVLSDVAHLVHPQEQLFIVQDDEADNRILECAVAAQVDFIVSGDRHLRKLRSFRSIPILNPRAFWEALTKA